MTTIDSIIVTDDGYRVDLETGEVVGMDEETPQEERELIDFVLERRARANAKAEGLTAEMNLLVAGIKDRFETRIKEQERKVEWLDSLHGPMITKWAMEQIEGGKAKSVKTTWATLGFRASRERLEVLDMDKALAWAERVHPEAVKTEKKLLVSNLPKDGLPDCFELHVAGERQDFYVKHEG